ncbi:MAG: FtsX-like permease family protein [Chloroflexota bacterium]
MTNGLLFKVWYDLWGNKSRTMQVVLVIALGSMAIGLVIGGRNLIEKAVNSSHHASEPYHIKLILTPPITQDQLDRVGKIQHVYQVEGLNTTDIEWRFSESDAWQSAEIKSRESYQAQLMGVEATRDGVYPGRNSIGIGLLSVGQSQMSVGDTVQIRFGDRLKTYPVVGQLDPVGPEPALGEIFYVDHNTYTDITGLDSYNLIQLRAGEWDPNVVNDIDLQIINYFDSIGVDSVGEAFPFQDRIVPPDTNPATPILNALFLILGIIGAVVVMLGIFLVYNSISAIVSQQTSQIGVMKAIGASSSQVAGSYLLLVISYGLLAVLVSVPAGIFAAFGLQSFFGGFLNIESVPLSADITAVMVQIGVCIAAPLLAAAVPLSVGMRITVREAISTYGLADALGLINRLVATFKSAGYTLVLTIGNTFRNQKRVIIIEIALILAGTIFMMVIGVNDASRYTFNGKAKAIHPYQVAFATESTERIERLERIALGVDGVADVETWSISNGSARPVDQAEQTVADARIRLIGQPIETDFYRPDLLTGRWLVPGDRYAAVVGSVVSREKGWETGDELILTNQLDKEIRVTIVGIHFDPVGGGVTIHMPLTTVQTEWGRLHSGNALMVKTIGTDSDSQLRLAAELKETLEGQGVSLALRAPYGEATIDEVSSTLTEGLSIIITLLVVMAVVIAVVGGVGLSGVLSLSVLERRREIGVMRAIGASSGQVTRLFIGEGILLGWISWVIAIPLSIPAAWYLATRGLAFVLNTDLVYRFTLSGPLIWLGVITLLAIVSSMFPARRAARVSVRESLSYA